MNYNHEVIFCIVNAGFADSVMSVAREHGASGGTVLGAKGTANPESEKLFGVYIQPEKEIVMILVDVKIKNDILNALYDKVGLNTAGGGIAFSMPVSEVIGLGANVTAGKKQEKNENKDKNE